MANLPLEYGQYYHIYNRGNNGENLFVEERNYSYFLRLYAKYIQPVAETYAYCLMPNHFHFLIRTMTEEEQQANNSSQIGPFSKNGLISKNGIFEPRKPSRAFNNLFIAYARAFNRATARTGVLFETPFHRKLVCGDEYFRRLMLYIHTNSVKHGFVDDFRSWKWSSYNTILSKGSTKLARMEVVEWFGGREIFEECHQVAVDENWFNQIQDDFLED